MQPGIVQRGGPEIVAVGIDQIAQRREIGRIRIPCEFILQKLRCSVVAESEEGVHRRRQHAADLLSAKHDLVIHHVAEHIGIDDKALSEQQEGRRRLQLLGVQRIGIQNL